jgi:hypothetical protein
MRLRARVRAILLGKAHSMRLDARVSAMPLSKCLSRRLGFRVSAIPLGQALFRCLVARVLVFLPDQSPLSRLGARVGDILPSQSPSSGLGAREGAECRLMVSPDGETSLNLENGLFRASLFQITLPYRNGVLFDRPRPTAEALEIPTLVGHASASLDGGSLAIFCSIFTLSFWPPGPPSLVLSHLSSMEHTLCLYQTKDIKRCLQ